MSPGPGRYAPPMGNPRYPQPPRKPKSGFPVAAVVIGVICCLIAVASLALSLLPGGPPSQQGRPQQDLPPQQLIPQESSQADQQIRELFSDPTFTSASPDRQRQQAQNLLGELHQQGHLRQPAVYDQGNELFTFTYSDGMYGGISLKEFDDTRNSGGSTTRPTGPDLVSAYTGEGIQVLILNGFENTQYRKTFYYELIDRWADLGISSTLDFTITVSDLLELETYDIITFSFHGSMYDGEPVLCLDETVTDLTDANYSRYLYTDRSVARVFCTDGNFHYWVFPRFFTDNYQPGDLDGKVFFSETCMFYGCDCTSKNPDASFSDSLLSLSAELVIGYHNSVGADYSRDVMKYTLERMFEGEEAGSALTSAIGIYGTNDGWNEPADDKYPAYPILQGDRNAVITGQKEDYPTTQELFNETYWHWSTGPTNGMNYIAKFHLNGTFDYISMGSLEFQSGTYRYRDGVLTIGASAMYDLQSSGSFVSRETYESAMSGGDIHYTLTPSSKEQWDFLMELYLDQNDDPKPPTQETEPTDPPVPDKIFSGAYQGDGVYDYALACQPFYDGTNFDIYVFSGFRNVSYWARNPYQPTLAKICYTAGYDATDVVYIDSIQEQAAGTFLIHAHWVSSGQEVTYRVSGNTITFTDAYGSTVTGQGPAIALGQRVKLAPSADCAFINDEQLAHEPISYQKAMELLASRAFGGFSYVTITVEDGMLQELVIAFVP